MSRDKCVCVRVCVHVCNIGFTHTQAQTGEEDEESRSRGSLLITIYHLRQ